MSLSIPPDSSDLTFDAVPDQPRECFKKDDHEGPIANNAPEKVEETAARAETTTKTDIQLAPIPQKDSASEKNTKPGKKGGNKSRSTSQKGATIFNINKSTGIHVGNNFIIQSNGSNTFPKPGSNIPKATKEIKKLMQSTEIVDDIGEVSGHIGVNWMEVGRQLKYTDGQLEQFYEDHGKKGIKEVVYQMLLDWKRANASKATVGWLSTALWTSNQYDAVERLGVTLGKK